MSKHAQKVLRIVLQQCAERSVDILTSDLCEIMSNANYFLKHREDH